MCAQSFPGKKDEPDKYGIDVARLEFALKAREIPTSHWQEAEYWMGECCQALNDPKDDLIEIEDDG
jgi:hypothetical protein